MNWVLTTRIVTVNQVRYLYTCDEDVWDRILIFFVLISHYGNWMRGSFSFFEICQKGRRGGGCGGDAQFYDVMCVFRVWLVFFFFFL